MAGRHCLLLRTTITTYYYYYLLLLLRAVRARGATRCNRNITAVLALLWRYWLWTTSSIIPYSSVSQTFFLVVSVYFYAFFLVKIA